MGSKLRKVENPSRFEKPPPQFTTGALPVPYAPFPSCLAPQPEPKQSILHRPDVPPVLPPMRLNYPTRLHRAPNSAISNEDVAEYKPRPAEPSRIQIHHLPNIHLASQFAVQNHISYPQPKPYSELDSPIYVNTRCGAKMYEAVLAIAHNHRQPFDIRFAGEHLPNTAAAVFVCIKGFFGNGMHCVGVYVPDGVAWDAGRNPIPAPRFGKDGTEDMARGDGFGEMFFTACDDEDLKYEEVKEQLCDESGIEGSGLADVIEAPQVQVVGKKRKRSSAKKREWDRHRNVWEVAALVWNERVEGNLLVRRLMRASNMGEEEEFEEEWGVG
ncbi:hypothetical protein K432DRAFT_384184 [Lepidopterella palustris CBS 459.81]|uniref:Uncharacterized protein n=1 Tax=Lepidopterella palustris CBS 459.81 TaxID=1314670 RepID=A0A8E2E5Z9_9PEZI|nr:hypothetical protein K432DRAFT_384184 [Lepidopterella palustris CBS 459.81]